MGIVEFVLSDKGLFIQEGVDGSSQGTAAFAMDDADRTESGSQCLIEEPFDFGYGFGSGLADNVELCRNRTGPDWPEGRTALFPFLFLLFLDRKSVV